jgi:hypothetical protein
MAMKNPVKFLILAILCIAVVTTSLSWAAVSGPGTGTGSTQETDPPIIPPPPPK